VTTLLFQSFQHDNNDHHHNHQWQTPCHFALSVVMHHNALCEPKHFRLDFDFRLIFYASLNFYFLYYFLKHFYSVFYCRLVWSVFIYCTNAAVDFVFFFRTIWLHVYSCGINYTYNATAHSIPPRLYEAVLPIRRWLSEISGQSLAVILWGKGSSHTSAYDVNKEHNCCLSGAVATDRAGVQPRP